MDPRYGTPPVPRFPAFTEPRCQGRGCGAVCELSPKASDRERPFYKCPKNACGKWCTYDDVVGIIPGNPLCDCGFYCRKTLRRDGETFETCPFGKCEMLEYKARSRGSSPSVVRQFPSNASSSPAAPVAGSRPPARTATSTTASLDGEFVRLLEHVIVAAKRTSFPTRATGTSDVVRGPPDNTGTASRSATPAPFRLQSSTEFERHSKVGAAGELFNYFAHQVYAFLRHVLRKGAENRIWEDHWQSNMRNLVRRHLDICADWPEWTKAETADIVFPDKTGALTDLLIANGYLEYARWYDQGPDYMIEIKSTMSNRNKEFYMSSQQYTRMESHSNSSGQRSTIYMIARVTNLQESKIDLQLFVDPCGQESNLNFKQVWVVEPNEEK